ncbi:ABC transporter substrate-binding protein [Gordonia iterans]|uniref:ABC transporter substrate-binding protein n=1 Tax=Gordonia iterans TaxID=1004901 RepID=UPI001F3FBFD6|nr:ABC transporter substrate-binding protein [Gordonia iterans]
MKQSRRWAATGAAVILAVSAVTGCSSSNDEPTPPDQSLRQALPANIRDAGTLTVGTSGPYAPLVFEQSGELTGFDVEVVRAVAERLGLNAEFTQAPFADLLPGVADGSFDSAARGMFATLQRQQTVDQVTYYSAGTQWLGRAGADLDPNDACGKRIGAAEGTVQFTVELPAKSAACTDTGSEAIEIIGFDDFDQAVDALAKDPDQGGIDGISADSPVVQYAAKTSDGKFDTAGAPFDTEPYAIAVKKDSALGPVVQKAVQQLIDDGELRKIAEKWGLEAGLIETSLLNGALI